MPIFMKRTNYIIYDQDKKKVEKLQLILSKLDYNCLSIYDSFGDFNGKIALLKNEPDLFFIGDVENLKQAFTTIKSNFKHKSIIMVCNKSNSDFQQDNFFMKDFSLSYIFIN